MFQAINVADGHIFCPAYVVYELRVMIAAHLGKLQGDTAVSLQGPISPSAVKPSGVELFYGIDFTPPKILNLTNRFYPMR